MNPQLLLHTLQTHEVEFIIVGGAAMILHGSAYLTDDLDIVYSRDPENIQKVVAALASFKPQLRTSGASVKFRFDERTLKNGLNFTLTTSEGNLDLLGEIAGLGKFDTVLKWAEKLTFGGHEFNVLSLSGLIRSKKAAGRKKDLIAIPELKALEEIHKKVELPRKPKPRGT